MDDVQNCDNYIPESLFNKMVYMVEQPVFMIKTCFYWKNGSCVCV
jgi:hypothetical protein